MLAALRGHRGDVGGNADDGGGGGDGTNSQSCDVLNMNDDDDDDDDEHTRRSRALATLRPVRSQHLPDVAAAWHGQLFVDIKCALPRAYGSRSCPQTHSFIERLHTVFLPPFSRSLPSSTLKPFVSCCPSVFPSRLHTGCVCFCPFCSTSPFCSPSFSLQFPFLIPASFGGGGGGGGGRGGRRG